MFSQATSRARSSAVGCGRPAGGMAHAASWAWAWYHSSGLRSTAAWSVNGEKSTSPLCTLGPWQPAQYLSKSGRASRANRAGKSGSAAVPTNGKRRTTASAVRTRFPGTGRWGGQVGKNQYTRSPEGRNERIPA